MIHHISKKTVAVSAAALAFTCGAAAFAWTVGATGSGTGGTGTTSKIDFRNPPLVGLWPGQPTTIGVEYKSLNAGNVTTVLAPRVVSVKDSAGNEIGDPGGACERGNFSIDPPVQKPTLGPATAFTSVGAALDPRITLSLSAPNTCQGVTVTLDYTTILPTTITPTTAIPTTATATPTTTLSPSATATPTP